jgi:hypothetical protein
MKSQLALVAAIGFALAACDGMVSAPIPTLPPGVGSEVVPPSGSEPTNGGPEPGLTGQDPPPGGRGANTIAGLCAQVCTRLATACGGQSGEPGCAGDCTAEVTAAGTCQGPYVEFLRCLVSAPFTCDGTNINLPQDCYDEVLALAACQGAVPTPTSPPTAGASPVSGR